MVPWKSGRGSGWPLALVLLQCLNAVSSQSSTTISDAAGLVAALQDPSVSEILVVADVDVTGDAWAGITVPVPITRNLTIQGRTDASYNQGFPSLNLRRMSQKLTIAENITLLFSGLKLIDLLGDAYITADIVAQSPGGYLQFSDCILYRLVCGSIPGVLRAALANKRPATIPGTQLALQNQGWCYTNLEGDRKCYQDSVMLMNHAILLAESDNFPFNQGGFYMISRNTSIVCDYFPTQACLTAYGAATCVPQLRAQLEANDADKEAARKRSRNLTIGLSASLGGFGLLAVLFAAFLLYKTHQKQQTYIPPETGSTYTLSKTSKTTTHHSSLRMTPVDTESSMPTWDPDRSDNSSMNGTSYSKAETARTKIDALTSMFSRSQARLNQPASDDLVLLDLIAKGGSGVVHQGMWRGSLVAVKTIQLHKPGPLEQMVMQEVAISLTLAHPNVLQTYCFIVRELGAGQDDPAAMATPRALLNNGQARAFSADSTTVTNALRDGTDVLFLDLDMVSNENNTQGYEVQLVLEYADKGSLRNALNHDVLRHGGKTIYQFVLETALEVASAMVYLHDAHIVHADLKAENVLLKAAAGLRGFCAKVADFGTSFRMDAQGTHVSNRFLGTPTHMAPEVLLAGRHSKSADVYAFGILMYELYTGRYAFENVPKALLGQRVSEVGERPLFPEGSPAEYRRLAEKAWHGDANIRPTFREIQEALIQELAKVRAKGLPCLPQDLPGQKLTEPQPLADVRISCSSSGTDSDGSERQSLPQDNSGKYSLMNMLQQFVGQHLPAGGGDDSPSPRKNRRRKGNLDTIDEIVNSDQLATMDTQPSGEAAV